MSIISSLSLASSKRLWNLNLQWHMLLLSTLMMRGICLAYICVCVFVRVNLFALSTRGVFWWTLSHPEQKRQQVLSSAACFWQSPPPPKGVTFSPCFVGLCILLFSIVPIWSSLIFPAGQTHCSTAADPMGAMFQTAAHFHTASTCAVGGGGRWPWCLFISSLTNIFITRAEKQWEKKQQPCDESMAAPRGVLLFVVTQRTSYANWVFFA